MMNDRETLLQLDTVRAMSAELRCLRYLQPLTPATALSDDLLLSGRKGALLPMVLARRESTIWPRDRVENRGK